MNPPMSATHRSRSSNQWHATMSAIWLQCRPYATAGRQCRHATMSAIWRMSAKGLLAPQHCGSAIGRRFAIVAKREASSVSSASRPYVGKVVHMSASPIVHMSASRPYVGKSSICRQVVHVSASRPYVGKSSNQSHPLQLRVVRRCLGDVGINVTNTCRAKRGDGRPLPLLQLLQTTAALSQRATRERQHVSSTRYAAARGRRRHAEEVGHSCTTLCFC